MSTRLRYSDSVVLFFVLGGACSGTISAGKPPTDVVVTPVPEVANPGVVEEGPSGPTEMTPMLPESCSLPPERVWRLGHAQLSRVLDDVASITEKDKAQDLASSLAGFEPPTVWWDNEIEAVAGDALFFEETQKIAGRAAALLVQEPKRAHPCLAQGYEDDACLTQALATIASKAYRRSVAGAELQELKSYFTSRVQSFGKPGAFELTVRRVLGGPGLLFRTELGALNPAGGLLAPHETAQLVSFFLLNGPPDEGLKNRADDGTLGQKEVLQKEVQRLMATKNLPGIREFFRQWTRGDRDVHRPEICGPSNGCNRGRTIRSFPISLYKFVESVLYEGDGTLKTLLTEKSTFINDQLGKLYGYASYPPNDSTYVKVPVESPRGGLLTQGAMVTVRAVVTSRALWIRDHLLCSPVPLPMEDVDMSLSDDAEKAKKSGQNLSPRQIREQHTSNPRCAGCHKMLDTLGYPFEVFDNVGRLQSMELGFPIDTRGGVHGVPSGDKEVANVSELIEVLANSKDVRACFVNQLFTYALGREPRPADRCELERLTQRFETSNGHIPSLIADLATSDAFRFRAAQKGP